MPRPTTGQQRDSIKAISPPWLQNDAPPINGSAPGVGGRYMYNIGLAADAVLDKLNQAQQAHMPTVCPPSALPFLGNDRVLTQGPGESNASFRVRLQTAFQTWQHAGERRAVMEQIEAYLSGYEPSYQGVLPQVPIVTIVGAYQANLWSTFFNYSDFTGPPANFRPSVPIFSWDREENVEWWRNWLVLFFSPIPTGLGGSGATFPGGSLSLFQPNVGGLSGIPLDIADGFRSYLILGNSADPLHVGIFQIMGRISATEVQVCIPGNDSPSDGNSGSINWQIVSFPTVAPAPVFGAAIAGSSTTITIGGNSNLAIGLQLPGAANSVNAAGYFSTMRDLLRLWKSAGTYYPNILVSWAGFDQTAGNEFSPYNSPGIGSPDGNWGSWAKAVPVTDTVLGVHGLTLVPSRRTVLTSLYAQLSNFLCVCDGTGIYQQSYTPTGT